MHFGLHVILYCMSVSLVLGRWDPITHPKEALNEAKHVLKNAAYDRKTIYDRRKEKQDKRYKHYKEEIQEERSHEKPKSVRNEWSDTKEIVLPKGAEPDATGVDDTTNTEPDGQLVQDEEPRSVPVPVATGNSVQSVEEESDIVTQAATTETPPPPAPSEPMAIPADITPTDDTAERNHPVLMNPSISGGPPPPATSGPNSIYKYFVVMILAVILTGAAYFALKLNGAPGIGLGSFWDVQRSSYGSVPLMSAKNAFFTDEI